MVGQNAGQLALVFWLEQCLNSSGWQFCEGFVARCKHREWPWAFQGIDKISGPKSRSQRLEFSSLHGCLNDVCRKRASCHETAHTERQAASK